MDSKHIKIDKNQQKIEIKYHPIRFMFLTVTSPQFRLFLPDHLTHTFQWL